VEHDSELLDCYLDPLRPKSLPGRISLAFPKLRRSVVDAVFRYESPTQADSFWDVGCSVAHATGYARPAIIVTLYWISVAKNVGQYGGAESCLAISHCSNGFRVPQRLRAQVQDGLNSLGSHHLRLHRHIRTNPEMDRRLKVRCS
jgi:hypothetical protein